MSAVSQDQLGLEKRATTEQPRGVPRAGSPILVTGMQRSGTTWVGRTLCFSKELGYIQEPFNYHRKPSWAGNTFQRHFQYICTENEGPYEDVLERILRFRFPIRGQLHWALRTQGLARLIRENSRSLILSRPLGLRPLLKDPGALFSAPWLADRFGLGVVVTIRRPAAVVASLMRQNWDFDFRHLADQDFFMRDHSRRFAEQILEFAKRPPPLLHQGILLWNVVYDAVSRFRESQSSWVFVKHEDLAQQPVQGFRDMYARFDLHWSGRAENKIRRYTGPGNPKEKRPGNARFSKRDSRATTLLWREHLTPEEAWAIREGTFEVARHFYAEEEL